MIGSESEKEHEITDHSPKIISQCEKILSRFASGDTFFGSYRSSINNN